MNGAGEYELGQYQTHARPAQASIPCRAEPHQLFLSQRLEEGVEAVAHEDTGLFKSHSTWRSRVLSSDQQIVD